MLLGLVSKAQSAEEGSRSNRHLGATGASPRRVTFLDAAKLGPSLSVFIQVTLEKQIEEMLESFEQSSKRFPEVMECYLMTGDSDCLLRVVGRDTVELQHFIVRRQMI